MDKEGSAKMQAVWAELQGELATLSTNVDHRVITDATHYIHWDNPEAVITAVADVITAQRAGMPVRQAA